MDRQEPFQWQLQNLEVSLLNPDIRHLPTRLSRLLADNFIEFGSTGQVYDKKGIIAALVAEPDTQISITEFKVTLLAANIALVTYRATYSNDRILEKHSLRSSIWKLTDGNWQMLFHQGTPIL
jgi:hypothetical protein